MTSWLPHQTSWLLNETSCCADFAVFVDVVRSASQRTGNPSIGAPFQKTIEYSSQYALKAAETRRKNTKAKETVQ